MEKKPQTLANHAKLDPRFHFFVLPLALAVMVISVVRIFRNPGFDSAWGFVLAIGLVMAVFLIRVYPLKVQDRVIRLEERLRLATILPERMRMRIGELTEAQLVALRFAPDAEVAALVEKSLNDKLASKQIKQGITNWRADYFRV